MDCALFYLVGMWPQLFQIVGFTRMMLPDSLQHFSTNYVIIPHRTCGLLIFIRGMMSRLKTRTARLREIESQLLLSPEGLTALELATLLAVDRRTIYRDVEFLCA